MPRSFASPPVLRRSRTLSRRGGLLAVALAVSVPVSFGAALVGAPRPAEAGKKLSKKQQAKAYVDAGLAAQDGGDYASAIDFYEKANALVPHPLLVFNLAQAHRLAGHSIEALDHYRRYLVAEPKGSQAKAAAAFIKELEPMVATLEEAKAKAAAEATAAERKRIADERRKRDAASKAAKHGDDDDDDARTRGGGDDDDDDDTDPPPEDPGLSGKRIAGVTLGGLGLVSIGVGVVFGLKAAGLSRELSRAGAIYDPQKDADGEAAEKNMFIGYGLGGALLVTGIVLFALGGNSDSGDEESDGLSLAPTVDRDGAGLVLLGDF